MFSFTVNTISWFIFTTFFQRYCVDFDSSFCYITIICASQLYAESTSRKINIANPIGCRNMEQCLFLFDTGSV